MARTAAKPPPVTREQLDELGPDWPIGIAEICSALGEKRSSVDVWRYRNQIPDAEPTTIGGRPFWRWGKIRQWAIDTGRLEVDPPDGDPVTIPAPRQRPASTASTATSPEADALLELDDVSLPGTPEAQTDDEGAVIDPFAGVPS